MNSPISQPKRILMVRLSALGDIIHTLPAYGELRHALPDTEIHWAVEDRFSGVIRHLDGLDKVIPLRRKSGKRAILQDLWNLGDNQYDAVLDFQGLLKSAIVARASKAKMRYGFGPDNSREGAHRFYTHFCLAKGNKHNIVELNTLLVISMLEDLGVSWRDTNPMPEFLGEEDHQNAAMTLEHFNITSPFAMINPCGAWASKWWVAERYAAVCDYLTDTYGIQGELTCFGGKEKAFGEKIMAAAKHPIVMVDSLTFTQQAAFAKLAKIAIGPDTGPLHLAHAVNCPCVYLFGPSIASRNAPPGEHTVAIQSPFSINNVDSSNSPNAPHYKEDMRFLEAIPVDMVTEAIDQLLKPPAEGTANLT